MREFATIVEHWLSDRWHVAVIDPGTVARHARLCVTPAEAVSFDERCVAAQQDTGEK